MYPTSILKQMVDRGHFDILNSAYNILSFWQRFKICISFFTCFRISCVLVVMSYSPYIKSILKFRVICRFVPISNVTRICHFVTRSLGRSFLNHPRGHVDDFYLLSKTVKFRWFLMKPVGYSSLGAAFIVVNKVQLIQELEQKTIDLEGSWSPGSPRYSLNTHSRLQFLNFSHSEKCLYRPLSITLYHPLCRTIRAQRSSSNLTSYPYILFVQFWRARIYNSYINVTALNHRCYVLSEWIRYNFRMFFSCAKQRVQDVYVWKYVRNCRRQGPRYTVPPVTTFRGAPTPFANVFERFAFRFAVCVVNAFGLRC